MCNNNRRPLGVTFMSLRQSWSNSESLSMSNEAETSRKKEEAEGAEIGVHGREGSYNAALTAFMSPNSTFRSLSEDSGTTNKTGIFSLQQEHGQWWCWISSALYTCVWWLDQIFYCLSWLCRIINRANIIDIFVCTGICMICFFTNQIWSGWAIITENHNVELFCRWGDKISFIDSFWFFSFILIFLCFHLIRF